MSDKEKKPHIAVACGGTGGHLFPGLAVARELIARGCRITLFVSEKEVDRRAVQGVQGMNVVALPSVGLVRGRRIAFVLTLWKSVRMAKRIFSADPPDAVLAMGGFTSAAPVIAGRKFGASCFLHESNTIPGRANRWLSRYSDQVFVGFESAGPRFKDCSVKATGTPVRAEFKPVASATAREHLGLRPNDPVLLVMGGSQGASGINRLVMEVLPRLVEQFPLLQFVHLTGVQDIEQVQSVYHRLGVKALVQLFCADMNHALGAATLTISRAGASSLAEIAAVRAPSVLVPYPSAADNHQYFNAKEFADSGAARLVDQGISATDFEAVVVRLLSQEDELRLMKSNLGQWDSQGAAAAVAETVCSEKTIGEEIAGKRGGVDESRSTGADSALRTVNSMLA